MSVFLNRNDFSLNSGKFCLYFRLGWVFGQANYPTLPPFPFPPSLSLMHSVECWAWDRKVDIALGIFVRRVLTTIDCGKYLSLVFSSYPVIFRAILMLCFCGIQSRYYRR